VPASEIAVIGHVHNQVLQVPFELVLGEMGDKHGEGSGSACADPALDLPFAADDEQLGEEAHVAGVLHAA